MGEGSLKTHPPISHNVEVVSLVKSGVSGGVSGGGNGQARNVKKFHKVHCLHINYTGVRYWATVSFKLVSEA